MLLKTNFARVSILAMQRGFWQLQTLSRYSDGQPSEFGESGLQALEIRLKNLFERFTASLAVNINEVRIDGCRLSLWFA